MQFGGEVHEIRRGPLQVVSEDTIRLSNQLLYPSLAKIQREVPNGDR